LGKVVAVEIDAVRLEMARHNALVYKQTRNIEFVNADVFDVLPHAAADVVFLAPPWGGVSYSEREKIDVMGDIPVDM
jgi:trimethylguanosine synthase